MNAKDECQVLMDNLLPMAKRLLKKNREFYPIGAVMGADGSITPTATFDGNEFPESQQVINSLIRAHRDLARTNKLKVSGMAYNAAVSADGKKTDAIILSLEHRSGYSVTVVVPYKITLFRMIKYGRTFAQQGSHDVF